MGILYIVATPIGNLEDVSLRALRILKEVAVIAAEDTRTTQKLLQRYDIPTPLLSYFEGNQAQRIPELLERLERDDVALASEAGVPGIRDPGLELVKAAQEAGYNVVPIPGPSAITTALSVSGMQGDEFLFLGFLPSRKTERRKALEEVSLQTRTLVLFESPHRLADSLKDMAAALGPARRVAVCRELTKLHEEVFRGTLSEAQEHFVAPRGEFTLVIEGTRGLEEQEPAQAEDILADLRLLKEAHAPVKEAMAQMAKVYGLSRRQAYKMWLEVE
ncbi:MAG: 16S rRNA (cytidine(1402)-2'-O)-methyltransferase [Chloroflexi bacterium]|nr:16S rRNA (cytidine(1402)-2'-O)-methyltransferase [Chloroflexota bacterium]